MFCSPLVEENKISISIYLADGLFYTLYMERLVCLIFYEWTNVSRCVQKASRRVHYIFRYEHFIGRFGLIATRYVHNTDMFRLVGVMDKGNL